MSYFAGIAKVVGSQQKRTLDFRFGSKADIARHLVNVRFVPHKQTFCAAAETGAIRSPSPQWQVEVPASKPSDLAILRLITNSNLVGNFTGRSAAREAKP
jgi:hypothetical protein